MTALPTSPRFRRSAAWLVAASAGLLLATAPSAAADVPLPVPGNGPASDAITQLQSAGYNVMINWLEGHPNVPLSECKVTGISGLRVSMTSDGAMMMQPASFDNAYVDVACPNAK